MESASAIITFLAQTRIIFNNLTISLALIISLKESVTITALTTKCNGTATKPILVDTRRWPRQTLELFSLRFASQMPFLGKMNNDTLIGICSWQTITLSRTPQFESKSSVVIMAISRSCSSLWLNT